MRAPHPRAAAAAIAAIAVCALALLAGCGKSLPRALVEPGLGPVGARGAASVSTANTTRLGGATPTIDAAAVATAVYPGLTPATRPRAVVLVSAGNWPDALAASVLAGAPLHAPLLYSDGPTLPAASARALRTMAPSGIGPIAGAPNAGEDAAKVIEIGETPTPAGYLALTIAGKHPPASPARVAVAVERFASRLSGHPPRQLIVTAAGGPPAMTMPAAGLAAQTGTPILYVDRLHIPPATAAELARIGRVPIYLVGPTSVVSAGVASELERYGRVTRIAGATPSANAVAVARFSDESWGWGVVEPGHGFVFANAARPFDAPAAAPLSATGDYGPLLLLESANRQPSALSGYLSDLQPGTPSSGAVHGVYNHGWLIGDESAISAVTQARLDTVLGVSSRPASEPTLATPTATTGEPGTTAGGESAPTTSTTTEP